jgi:hypothetical protein
MIKKVIKRIKNKKRKILKHQNKKEVEDDNKNYTVE